METEDFPKIIDIPDDGSREKEIYARYGLAMYFAQVFERGTINLLMLLELSPATNTRKDFDDLAQALDKQTAGTLIKRMRKAVEVDDTTAKMMEKALKTRNYLAHSFFHEHTVSFTIAKGQQQMLNFCDDARRLFIQADVILSPITIILREQYGVDNDAISAMEDNLRSTSSDHQ